MERVAWQQQSSFCYGCDAQAIQKVTCNIKRDDTLESFELAQLLGVSWSINVTFMLLLCLKTVCVVVSCLQV